MKSSVARLAVVIVLWLAGGPLPGGRAADLAQHLPQTAAVYFGWSDLLMPLGLDALDPNALTTMLKERFELPDDEERPAARLIQAVLMAARGSGGLAVFLAPKTGGLDVQFAVVLDGGGDAAGLAQRLDAVLPAASGAARQAATLEGVALSRVPGPEEGVVYWGRHGSLVLLAYGEAAARQTAACLAGKAAGLTDNAEFKQARARIAPGKGAWMFCLFGDFTRVGMPQIFEMLRESGELGGTDAARARRVCDALALGDFRSYYWHVEQSDYGSRSRALLRMPGEKRGVGKLYHQKPLTDADLQLIPRDAYWGAVGNLDLAALWNDLRQPLDEIDPEIMPAIEGGLTMMRTVLGFSITDHLLPALGDTWAVFDAPAHGGIMLTGTVAVVEVRDAAGLDGIIKRIIELVTPLARQGNVQLQLKSRMYDEHKVEYVVLGGVPSPFAPAWAFVDDRCVFGLIPQTVAAALPQVDAQQRKGSILDHPDVKQVRPGLPKEVVNFSVCNSEYFTRQVYPFILHLLMAAHSLMAPYMPADIAALQSVEQRARAARLGIGVTAVTPDGVYYDSVGPDDLLSVSGVTLGIAAVGAGGLLPALQEARQQARFVKAMSQLKMIGMAVHAYSAEHKEALPESLEALVTSGHVPREALTSPFDAPGTVSYTYIAPGKRMSQLRNPSELVLAFQHEPQEFEVVLLFADGHVRRLMFWDARAYIQSAYEAAGRSDMLPDRWR